MMHAAPPPGFSAPDSNPKSQILNHADLLHPAPQHHYSGSCATLTRVTSGRSGHLHDAKTFDLLYHRHRFPTLGVVQDDQAIKVAFDGLVNAVNSF